jgi:hypothetical protein
MLPPSPSLLLPPDVLPSNPLLLPLLPLLLPDALPALVLLGGPLSATLLLLMAMLFKAVWLSITSSLAT